MYGVTWDYTMIFISAIVSCLKTCPQHFVMMREVNCTRKWHICPEIRQRYFIINSSFLTYFRYMLVSYGFIRNEFGCHTCLWELMIVENDICSCINTQL